MAALSSTVTPNPWRWAISSAVAGHVGRRADVPRQHLDAAGDASAPRRSPRRSGARAAIASVAAGASTSIRSSAGFLSSGGPLHLVELPGALRQPFGDRLPRVGWRDASRALRRQVERRARHAEAIAPAWRRRRRRGGCSLRDDLVRLAQPDQQNARGRARRIDQRGLVLLAAEVAGGEQPAERAARAPGRAPRATAGARLERTATASSGVSNPAGAAGKDGGLERHKP